MSHTDRERRIRCSPPAFMALSAAQVSRLGFVDPPLDSEALLFFNP
jgi:hypothetical protein